MNLDLLLSTIHAVGMSVTNGPKSDSPNIKFVFQFFFLKKSKYAFKIDGIVDQMREIGDCSKFMVI
jgi:hypothetical protein